MTLRGRKISRSTGSRGRSSGFCFVAAVPPEWGQLDALQVLCIAGTGLAGPIPPELGDCDDLTGLQIVENDVDPQIPAELGRCSMLRVLHLDCLEGPTGGGAIPPELGNCRRLEHLNLSTLFMTGEIPPELAHCRRLKTLVLRQNDLSGQIPHALGDLNSLTDLDLTENGLTGLLPASIGSERPLRMLWLGDNQLTGGVPESFGACYALVTLALADSGLSGVLPEKLAERVQHEDARAADQERVLAAMGTDERLAYLAAEWSDNTVRPLLVELGVIEKEFPVDEQWLDGWPPNPTPAYPARVYVDDAQMLEATHDRQSDDPSYGR